ncbi:BACON domain-containing carbohydrate-binding protein [uncultured Rikenella sp.]|uniref:BACON domain-containing protein n=1 Tax=uncultured Rikenella sp. TaxID=368003 RepID=UPI0026134143|nr:BACON domain-containing carbohydrate-binding protein [uncultured Rikenella sp.]
MILTGDDKVKLFVGSTKVKAAYVETTRVYPNAILSVTPSMSFAAAGGEQILQIEVLEDQSWSIGGLPVGWSASASSGTGSASVKIIASNNTTVGGKNSTITVVSGDLSADCTVYQAAGVMVYGTPIVTAFGYPDIPAGGGTVSPNVYAYEQVYTWNGVPGSGGVLTTGGTIYYSNTSGIVSAESLDTIHRGRTAVATITTRVDMNGVTGQNATCNVYQEENKREQYLDKYMEVITSGKSLFEYTGGTGFFRVIPYVNYVMTSGATGRQTTSEEPTVKISGSGFSVRKTTAAGIYQVYEYSVTASANSSYSSRSATVTITLADNPTKTLAFSQSGKPAPKLLIQDTAGNNVSSITLTRQLYMKELRILISEDVSWSVDVPQVNFLMSLNCGGTSMLSGGSFTFSGSQSLNIQRGTVLESGSITLVFRVPYGNPVYLDIEVEGEF